MPVRINGVISTQQSLSGSIEYYTVYAKSPLAYTVPASNPDVAEEQARKLNILTTGNVIDQSQKNFEILFQSIGLRAVPVISNDPVAVELLENEGSPTLTGEGYIWKFACERPDTFKDYATDNPVGLLVSELDGVLIDSGVRITTIDGSVSGEPKNIEFVCVKNL